MTIQKCPVLPGQVDFDNVDTRFQWARPLMKTPLDKEGNPVSQPGSIMIYGPSKFHLEGIQMVYLLPRAVGGLFDLIPADQLAAALALQEMTEEEVPMIIVVETEVKEDMAKRTASREKRSNRREKRLNEAAALAAQALAGSAPAITSPSNA